MVVVDGKIWQPYQTFYIQGMLFNCQSAIRSVARIQVTAKVELIEVNGRKLVFEVEAHDGVDRISKGRHERFVINKAVFDAKVDEKRNA